MKVSTHIISTSVICLILVAWTDWYNVVLFFVGGVLIDADHYLNYAKREKDLSLIRAYRWHCNLIKEIRANSRKYMAFHVFHSVEFILLVLVFSYFFGNYFFLLGVFFHSLLDTTEALRYKALGVRKLSFLQYLFIKARDKEDKIII